MTDDAHRSRARSAAAQSEATAVRRIGEALLLAQNRARMSTERANRSEHILRSVLSQINLQSGVLLHELEDYPRSMSLDSLADWDLLHTLIEGAAQDAASGPRYVFPTPRPIMDAERTSFALSMAEARGAPHTLSSVPHDYLSQDLHAVTRDVVMNLHVAARTAERRIQKMKSIDGEPTPPRGWLSIHVWLMRMLQVENSYYFRPWQFVAGVMIGFAVGVVTTKRFLVQQAQRASASRPALQSALLMDRPSLPSSSSSPPLSGGMTCRGDALTQRQMNRLHLAASRLPVTFAMEDMSYLLHPPTEVS